MPTQEAMREAAGVRRLPPWQNLDRKDREELIAQILLLVAQNKPLPRPLLEPLPTPLLQKLLRAVRQLQGEGLLGPRHRVPERLQRLRELLAGRGLSKPKQPSENEVLAQQPKQMQREVLAQESRGLREAQARAAVGMQQTLAATNDPTLRLPQGAL